MVTEDRRESLRRSMALMWGATKASGRGPKPGLSVERIVRAGVELADAEGLAAISIRRIAGSLGVGAMTLYRYVPGKAELVDLMVDAAYGELLPEEEPEGDWRARLAASARRTWEMFMRHPWMLQSPQGRPLLGPNSMRSTETALSALDGLGLDEYELMAVAVTVDAYVAGQARSAIDAMQAAAVTGVSDEEWWATQGEFLAPAVLAGELPRLTTIGNAGVFEATDVDYFGWGLDRLLDGIAVRLRCS